MPNNPSHRSPRRSRFRLTSLALAALIVCTDALVGVSPGYARGVTEVVTRIQRQVVKIYGAGGIRGLEAYQSGFLVSPDGYVLTVWSYVLDTTDLAVVLDDGSRYQAEVYQRHPILDLALLKIDATGLPHFDLTDGAELSPGQRVLAFSNLYGIASGNEPASVQHGYVSAVCPLSARQGRFQIPYAGDVYVLDAMTNNAGAAGGALTDHEGNLVGILGKEVKSRDHDVWLNYALPVAAFRESVQASMRGESIAARHESLPPVATPWTPDAMGLQLVPNLIPRTPPFVELVRPGSPAEQGGLQTDDLIVYVEGQMVRSSSELESMLQSIDRTRALSLSVIRDQQLVTLTLAGLED